VKKTTEKENKENISGASKVGSALDMINSKNVKTATTPPVTGQSNHAPVIKDHQAKNKTMVLSNLNSSRDPHHARTLSSTSSATHKPVCSISFFTVNVFAQKTTHA
jgi:hypothetical protein